MSKIRLLTWDIEPHKVECLLHLFLVRQLLLAEFDLPLGQFGIDIFPKLFVVRLMLEHVSLRQGQEQSSLVPEAPSNSMSTLGVHSTRKEHLTQSSCVCCKVSWRTALISLRQSLGVDHVSDLAWRNCCTRGISSQRDPRKEPARHHHKLYQLFSCIDAWGAWQTIRMISVRRQLKW